METVCHKPRQPSILKTLAKSKILSLSHVSGTFQLSTTSAGIVTVRAAITGYGAWDFSKDFEIRVGLVRLSYDPARRHGEIPSLQQRHARFRQTFLQGQGGEGVMIRSE